MTKQGAIFLWGALYAEGMRLLWSEPVINDFRLVPIGVLCVVTTIVIFCWLVALIFNNWDKGVNGKDMNVKN